ncbi:MAG: sensor histidine kinase [Rhizobacter sp.]
MSAPFAARFRRGTTAPVDGPDSQSAFSAPPLPALSLPPRPALHRGLWALPLLLSLVFVGAVLTWLRGSEQSERDEQRQELISDALTLDAKVVERIDLETRLLGDLAAELSRSQARPDDLAALPLVQQGLQRIWISLTWLDADNRIAAHLPKSAPQPDPALSRLPARVGLSSHLVAPLSHGGALVARYSPTDMLRQTVPWWLARKYDVRLLDSFDNEIAATAEGRSLPGQQTHRMSLEPGLADGYLELSARDVIRPWYRGLPITMVAGFVTLIFIITVMLRRQMAGVSRAEEAWRNEAAWRSAMEESLTVGLRARDLEGRLVYVNRAMADMVGRAPEELIGRLPPMPYWPPDSIEETMQRHQRNMAGRAPREGYESRWVHRDGRSIDVMIFETPLVDARGRQVGWMGSTLDITAAKLLAERERRQNESMAHHARLTMLGEVAATLAHELNQPLSAISSYNAGVINSLQRSTVEPDPTVLRALTRLGEQAAHAGRIVQRIREFLTRREPQLEPASINTIVEGGLTLLQRELDRRQVRVQLELAPELPFVQADAVLIEQVVINLVRNAGDALIEAGPKRELDTPLAERCITVRTLPSSDGHAVRLEVSDNGPGLQGRTIEALCAPFYSTKAEGMGMGLAICRSILEAHHGSFDAAEAAGGGACFSVMVPVALQAVKPESEEVRA